MGGGVGVSVYGSHRIVTERTRFAMPETGIGFFPDVGASWFLTRNPGELGTYVGLTGEPLGAADAILCGLADAFVPLRAVARTSGSAGIACKQLRRDSLDRDRHASQKRHPQAFWSRTGSRSIASSPLTRSKASSRHCVRMAASFAEKLLSVLSIKSPLSLNVDAAAVAARARNRKVGRLP